MRPTALLLGLSALLAFPVLSAAVFVGTGECRVRELYTCRPRQFIATAWLSKYDNITCFSNTGQYGVSLRV